MTGAASVVRRWEVRKPATMLEFEEICQESIKPLILLVETGVATRVR